MSHYQSLYAGYGLAMLAWLVIARQLPAVWPRPEAPSFAHPWREVGWVLLAAVATLGIGQLYVHGIRLSAQGALGVLAEAVNQAIIFSPLLGVLYLRKHALHTAWLPLSRLGTRLGVGVGLAGLALLVYALVRADSVGAGVLVARVFTPQNAALAMQVLLEDIAIALLYVRLQAALGRTWPVVLVALLFAAGHIPALLATGTSWHELGSLLLDTTLGVGIISVLQRGADVWWFWWVHFAMDMTQFYAVG